jgi:hypothetical protein
LEFFESLRLTYIGWDWGPRFAPQGIYRDLYLAGLDDGAYATNSHIYIYKAGQRLNVIANETNPWVVNISIDYLTANSGVKPSILAEIGGCNGNSTTLATAVGINIAELTFNISEGAVERWWPAEFGNLPRSCVMLETNSATRKPDSLQCKYCFANSSLKHHLNIWQ